MPRGPGDQPDITGARDQDADVHTAPTRLSDDDVARLTHRVVRRLTKLASRYLADREEEYIDPDDEQATGGSAYGADDVDARGGGVSSKGARFTIANCTFYNNSAWFGGAIGNEASQVSITGSTFDGNLSSNRGGAIYSHSAEQTIEDCLFLDNESHTEGGAIYSEFAKPTVVRCEFENNRASTHGGAMHNFSGTVKIDRCLFTNNRAENEIDTNYLSSGGAVHNRGGLITITSSLFHGNSAQSTGGAIYNNYSDAKIINCTIADNVAGRNALTGYGGGIANDSSAVPTITNTILWDNIADVDPSINEFHGSQSTLLHCTIAGGVPGLSIDAGGNQDTAPAFVDQAGGNYRLTVDSSCIDAGFGDTETPLLDLDGNGRQDSGQSGANGGAGSPNFVDIGAYEHQ